MSMCNDIDWENEETRTIVFRLLTELLIMLEDSCVSNPDGEWEKTVEDMMLNFAESGYPVFRASSALERGGLKG